MPKPTAEVKRAAEDALAIVGERMAPAALEDLKGAVFILLSHYYTGDMPQAVYQKIADDWLACLRKYPAWAVEQARIEYLSSNTRKPVPAAIVALCDRAISKDMVMKRQCERIIAAPVYKQSPAPMTEEERAESAKKVAEIVAEAKRNLAT